MVTHTYTFRLRTKLDPADLGHITDLFMEFCQVVLRGSDSDFPVEEMVIIDDALNTENMTVTLGLMDETD